MKCVKSNSSEAVVGKVLFYQNYVILSFQPNTLSVYRQ